MVPHNSVKLQEVYQLFDRRGFQSVFLLIFFFIGLVFRLASVFFTEVEPVDATGYINFALAILSMDPSKVTSAREPGFSIVLALVFLFFPSDYMTSRITTAVIGSFCIPMTFLTSNSLRNRLSEEGTEVNILLSYISSLLVALNPYLIIADGRGLREPITALIFLILLYFIFTYQRRPTSKGIVIITILCMITISIKFELLFIISSIIFLMAFYDLSHRGYSKVKWKSYILVTVIVLLTFIIENTLMSILYGGFISDLRASVYFEREFGYYESVTLVQYIFDHHTPTQLFAALYRGVEKSLELHRWIFGVIGFCLILIGFFYLCSKNTYEIPVCIILSIATQAFFIHVWGWVVCWRLFLPYAPLACICMSYTLIMVIKEIRVQITQTKVIKIDKYILVLLILAFLVLSYNQEAFRLIEQL